MEKPLPFVLENNGQLELNEEVLKIIEKSNNPRFLLFYGATRQGKSTTLNQIIRGNIDTWKYLNKQPFETRTRQASLTKGCDIFGPIKCSEIKRRHNLGTKINEDLSNDINSFINSFKELFNSVNNLKKELLNGFTVFQNCTPEFEDLNKEETIKKAMLSIISPLERLMKLISEARLQGI